MRLEESRRIIDEIDSEIVALLNRRASICRRIGELKTRAGLPVLDRDREDLTNVRSVAIYGFCAIKTQIIHYVRATYFRLGQINPSIFLELI